MKKRILICATAAVIAILLGISASAETLPAVSQVVSSYRNVGTLAVKAKKLAVTPSSPVLRLGNDGTGESLTLIAKATPVAASQVFSWQSANPAVATVDENGVVTPVGIGSTKIVCRTTDASNLQKQVKVTVKKLQVKSIIAEQSSYTIPPNGTVQIGYTINPANAYNPAVKWTTSDAKVATVDANGLVTAKKLGNCTITCKSVQSGVTAKIRIRVNFTGSDVYFLSIGQQSYRSASILVGCRQDADRFAATVEASSFGNSSTASGIILYDQTGEQIRQALDDLPSMGMDENDVTYVFYSGHGTSSSGGAIVGVDYASSTSATSLVRIEEIRAYLDKVPGTVVVVVDACYSGLFINSKSTGSGTDFAKLFVSAFVSAKNGKSLVEDNELAGKYKILVACRNDQLSYMIGNGYGSVFTQFVTQAGGVTGVDTGEIIVQKKMPADANGNGAVTLKELYNYAYPKILKRLKALFETTINQNMVVWPVADPYPVFARLG
ncbi:MAG: caspase family protein [Clostridia bacterium]|nr:caspase family protein [Clostridia bacterium]